MARTRIGIIGLGMASAPHAKSLLDLADRVEVAGAFSPSPARRAAFAREYGLPTVDSAEAIFADPAIAAVLILTPPNTHLDLVERAAKAGKHVLLEKPLEVTPERARAIVAVMEEAGRSLGIVLQNRFRPSALTLQTLMREGRLGQLLNVAVSVRNWRSQAYYDEPGRGTLARDGGGVLLTQGIHTIDLLVALAGLPEKIFAKVTTTPVHRMETEDMAAATLVYANGAFGNLMATTAAYPGFPERIELIGTEGSAVLEGDRLEVRLASGVVIDEGGTLGTGAGADPMAFSHQMHRALIADFLDAIESGRPPAVTGRDALAAHRLIEAVLASSEKGIPVSVGD